MTSRMLGQFVEKTGIPFVTTQLGKGVLDETSPKFLGCAALSAGDFVHRAIESADLIINVGHDVRSEEHTSELQSLMRISYAVFCLKKKKKNINSQQQLVHTSD